MTLLSEFDDFLQAHAKNYNMKFIYLVRDPRGLMNSRLRISRVQYKEVGRGADIAKKVGGHCRKMTENVEFIKNSEFWSSRTTIVRYEDVALRPKEFAKQLYKEVKIDYLPLIDQWIDVNTHSDSKRLNIYATARNSATIAFDWRNPHSNRRMPSEFLDDVQEYCGDMMDVFGYSKFNGEKEMFNMTLLPMVDKKEVSFLFNF